MSVKSISLKLGILETVHKALRAQSYSISFVGDVIYSQDFTYQELKRNIKQIEEHGQNLDVHLSPIHGHFSYTVFQDFTPPTLKQFRADGYQPCMRITIAKEAYQVIMRSLKFDVDNNIEALNNLQDKYKVKIGSAFLPGFYTKDGFCVATSQQSCRSISCPKFKKLLKI